MFGVRWHYTGLILATCFFANSPRAAAQPAASSPVVSPEVGADRKVTFRLKEPNLKSVQISGDFAAKDVAMTKDDKGIWSYTTGPLQPGIYGYYFKMDGLRVPDPGNLFISSGTDYLKSYFKVPSGDKTEFWAVRAVPHGALHEHYYISPSLGTTRRIIVYTPPGYGNAAVKTYPTVYLYHGSGDNETYWSHVGRANFIMDNLLAEGKVKPALLVMAWGHSSIPKGPEGGAKGVELYEVSKIEKDVLESIIPLMEKEYRVGKEAKDRAITGISMGGYQALTIGLNNPTKFGYVAGFSAGFRANQSLDANFKALTSDVEAAQKNLRFVWIGIGSEESGSIKSNNRVADFLKSKGIANEFAVVPGGVHSWLSWRAYLRDWLPKLFVEK